MSSALRSVPLPLSLLFLMAAPLMACAVTPADEKQPVQASNAATASPAKEAPTVNVGGKTSAIPMPPQPSTPVATSTLSNEPAAAPNDDCVDAGHELEDYPYIIIGGTQSIAEQVRLFPGDKVKIVGTDKEPKRVRFGDFWQSYVDGKEYTVSGTGPIAPAFDFGDYGSSQIRFKLLVTYRCHMNQKRDIGTHVGPKAKK